VRATLASCTTTDEGDFALEDSHDLSAPIGPAWVAIGIAPTTPQICGRQ
jgi:hypothetical protein